MRDIDKLKWKTITTHVPQEFRELLSNVASAEGMNTSQFVREVLLADLRRRGFDITDFPATPDDPPQVIRANADDAPDTISLPS